MEIGKVISLVLKSKGISQKQLAIKIGKTPTSISQIVSGTYNPSPETLKSIANVLGVPVALLHFLSLSEEDVPAEKRGVYKILYPTILSMVIEMFGEKNSYLFDLNN